MKNFIKLKHLLALLFIISSFISLRATHVMGSDITYASLGGGRYRVIVKIYRDCRGISLSTTNLRVSTNNGCSSGTSLTLSRTSIRNISSYCPGGTVPCSPANTAYTGKGIEEHTFEGTIDFTQSPFNTWQASGCCEVYFDWTLCCRNGAITTGQASQRFFSYAMLNICNIDSFTNNTNSTPVMANEPVGFICCNQPYFFNNGCVDNVDYDSLGYSLEFPLGTSRTNTLTYTNPLSTSVPMTPYCPGGGVNCTPDPYAATPEGFFLDAITGDVIFTPTDCSEVGVIVVQATEYRTTASGNRLVVGVIRRDMQLIVESCPTNLSPQITGTLDTAVCLGQQICYNIDATDGNGDTITLTWNDGVPGGSFTILNPNSANKQAQFCWLPDSNIVADRDYRFTVQAADDYCPIKAVQTRSFTVRLNSTPDVQMSPVAYMDSCQETATIGSVGPADGGLRYTWSIPNADTTARTGIDLMGPFTARYLLDGSHSVYLTVEDTLGYGCLMNDSVSVTVLCNVLPVELGHFDAKFTDNTLSEIGVKWISFVEEGVSAYLVQYSFDNKTFFTADSVRPIARHQNTKKYHSLFGVDRPSNQTSVFVRLMEVTKNGERNIISRTIFLDARNYTSIVIYPIPARTNQPVTFSGLSRGNQEIRITNPNGKIVFSKRMHISTNSVKLPKLNLPQGIYTVSIGEERRKMVMLN